MLSENCQGYVIFLPGGKGGNILGKPGLPPACCYRGKSMVQVVESLQNYEKNCIGCIRSDALTGPCQAIDAHVASTFAPGHSPGFSPLYATMFATQDSTIQPGWIRWKKTRPFRNLHCDD